MSGACHKNMISPGIVIVDRGIAFNEMVYKTQGFIIALSTSCRSSFSIGRLHTDRLEHPVIN